MDSKRLDVVIFGATGFTGRFTVKQATRLAKDLNFTWGIAGRRREALEDVITEFSLQSANIPIIIADLKDEASLKKMTARARCIVNCSGPYWFYGEPVIKACLATKTHHVDVSGEPQYMQKMQLEYNEAAQLAGVYIISACGFDSIPTDIGIVYTQREFNGELNSIETYLNTRNTSDVGGAVVHYGTWESAVHAVAHRNEMRELKQKLYPKKLPKLEPKLRTKLIHRTPVSPGWSTIFPGADRDVALGTQYFLYSKKNQRPVQIQTYVTFRSFLQFLAVALLGGIFGILSSFNCGRKLLLEYPKFLSGGFASHEGPSPESSAKTHFSVTFRGLGWSEKTNEPTDKHTSPTNREIITKVSGVDPAYGATCVSLLVSGLTILNESNKMPDNGGVLTPGAAFHQTSFINTLEKYGFKFEVLSSK